MKKQNVVATLGTLALVANLLLPGMAFGQADQQNQTASQNIDCVANPVFNFNAFPDAVTFDNLVAGPTDQVSYDAATDNDTGLPAANMLVVQDNRSGGVDGCPTTTPGFDVLATITTSLTNGTTTIPDNSFRVITSNEFAGPADCTIGEGEEVCYGSGAGTGNLHDVGAPELYDDFDRLPTTHFDKFNLPGAYNEVVANTGNESHPNAPGSTLRTTHTLDQSVLLLHTATSHNMTVLTNVVINGTIPGNQAPGAYTGTVQYTLQSV